MSVGDPRAALQKTVDFWRSWADRCTYRGPYRDAVVRSALALKLLTYAPTGAIVAAPTTSLPEEIGGIRNWDYRFTWIRDASFTLYALLLAGYAEEDDAFFSWIVRNVELEEKGVRILYPVSPEGELTERTLDHLEGYRGSRPVRVGNAVANQVQLDVYGEVLDALYFAHEAAGSAPGLSGGPSRAPKRAAQCTCSSGATCTTLRKGVGPVRAQNHRTAAETEEVGAWK